MRRIPLRALAIGAFFAVAFAYVAVVAAARQGLFLPAAQISCISILFCLLLVVVINPLLRLCRLRILNRQEIFLIFIMATVPAGLPVFGLPVFEKTRKQQPKRLLQYR